MNEFSHQGDVTFHPVDKIEGEKLNHQGSYILAYGETTGHKHVITVEKPEDMEIVRALNGQIFLNLSTEAAVIHEEHGPIILQPGMYLVEKEREYDWFGKLERSILD